MKPFVLPSTLRSSRRLRVGAPPAEPAEDAPARDPSGESVLDWPGRLGDDAAQAAERIVERATQAAGEMANLPATLAGEASQAAKDAARDVADSAWQSMEPTVKTILWVGAGVLIGIPTLMFVAGRLSAPKGAP